MLSPTHRRMTHVELKRGIPTMIRVDLLRSTVAQFIVRCEPHVLNVRHGCVVCAAARKMLRLGIDPAEKIDVRRDGEPAFDRCQSVAWWAALTVVETAEHGPRFRWRSTKATHSGTAGRSGVVGDLAPQRNCRALPNVRNAIAKGYSR